MHHARRAQTAPRAAASWTAALSAAVLAAAPGAADDDDAAPDGLNVNAAARGRDGVETFTPEYFALYSPVTAIDMVERVPGFSIDDGDDRRGFGATAGNVLINGERPSSKSPVSAELSRIAAANVERIDLIRGGSGDVDVRGQGQLVNVVLKEGADGAAATYEIELRYNQGHRLPWFVQATRSFHLGRADLSLSIELPSGQSRQESIKRRFDASGVLTELSDEFGQENYRDVTLTGNLTWRPNDRDVLNFNAKAYPWLWNLQEYSDVVDAAGAPMRTTLDELKERDGLYSEVGGDWERQLTDDVSFKIVGLDIRQDWDFTELFETVTPTGFGGAVAIRQSTERGERVGRGVVNWRATPRHALEFGLEGAFNFRDTGFMLLEDDGSGPVAVAVPVASTRVEELRGEAFVTDVWTVTPKLTAELGFTVEASRISQSGDAEQERDLSYPKPRFSLAYTAAGGAQYRFSLERDVSQLDFSEFASSVSLSSGTSNIGNPDLEPERSWRARGEWERRFGERGAVKLALFHDAVEGVSDLKLLADPATVGGAIYTGPGNIGDGTRTGASIEATADLAWFGLDNATLTVEGERQRTRVRDDITGASRVFQDEPDWSLYLEFRHDLPNLKAAWGWDYNERGAAHFFRADETQAYTLDHGDLDVYVETTRLRGMTVRFGVDNIFNPEHGRVRTFYDGLRSNDVITGMETRERHWGQFYNINVSGSF